MKTRKTSAENMYTLTRRYTVNDIQGLIDLDLDAAGLVLMPVFAGMIALGYSLYGFGLKDRTAFLKFAQYRMKMQKGLAEILFDNVRAGLLEMWCSEVRVTLTAWDRKIDSERLCWPHTKRDTGVVINARKIALIYISAVQQLPDYCDTAQHQLDVNDERTNALRKQTDRFRATLEGNG